MYNIPLKTGNETLPMNVIVVELKFISPNLGIVRSFDWHYFFSIS